MRPESKIVLIVLLLGTIAMILSTADIAFRLPNVLEIENNQLTLTLEGKIAFLAFVVGFMGFLFSYFLEIQNARKEMSNSSKGITNILKSINEKYEEVSKEFMIYPSLKPIIENHFNYLRRLHEMLEEYYKKDRKNLFDEYVTFWFRTFIDPDLSNCLNHLERKTLILESNRMDLFHSFISIFWNSVKENGKIYATSIVNPQKFWWASSSYLSNQAKLIREKSCKIYRYFICASDHDNWFKAHTQDTDALEANYKSGIKTRVVIFKNENDAGDFYKDVGLVDNFMAVENEIKGGNITKTTCYINSDQNRDKIETMERFFRNLEGLKNTIKSEDYESSEDFINKIKEIKSEIK